MGFRLLGWKTVELMTMNHLPDGQDLTNLAQPGMFTETAYAGVGFGLGFLGHAVTGARADRRHGRRGSHGAAPRARRSGSTPPSS